MRNILIKIAQTIICIFAQNCAMRLLLMVSLLFSTVGFSQESPASTKVSKKGSFYFYWGWNKSSYTKSDISFKGTDYDFTLYDVVADDRQSPFSANIYLNPANITIPQYNMRFGYFFNDKYNISFGVDHMKYVMRSNQDPNLTQWATISGHIENSGTAYDGDYDNTPFQIKPDFLLFEHTDGLNYLNFELRRQDLLYNYKKFNLNSVVGAGAGALMPKTNATLLNNERNDAFHFAGFGTGLMVGLNFEFYNRFYIQTETKIGYINMPDIRTTKFDTDKAKQHFSYLQGNVVFGINLNTKTGKKFRQ